MTKAGSAFDSFVSMTTDDIKQARAAKKKRKADMESASALRKATYNLAMATMMLAVLVVGEPVLPTKA